MGNVNVIQDGQGNHVKYLIALMTAIITELVQMENVNVLSLLLERHVVLIYAQITVMEMVNAL